MVKQRGEHTPFCLKSVIWVRLCHQRKSVSHSCYKNNLSQPFFFLSPNLAPDCIFYCVAVWTVVQWSLLLNWVHTAGPSPTIRHFRQDKHLPISLLPYVLHGILRRSWIILQHGQHVCRHGHIYVIIHTHPAYAQLEVPLAWYMSGQSSVHHKGTADLTPSTFWYWCPRYGANPCLVGQSVPPAMACWESRTPLESSAFTAIPVGKTEAVI